MSDASNASQLITLPKGGGALKGIGETFSPDLHTGTGNFTVPIAVPVGRNGIQPNLNLTYSTGQGNGPFGLGWSLAVPGISRKTSRGTPRYDDALDVFLLSGAEDLVPVQGSLPLHVHYRPRTEGLFARIVHHRNGTSDYWEVRSTNGILSTYGVPASLGSDPATVADPSDRTRIFSWRLTETADLFGNRIHYDYLRDDDPIDGPHEWDQLYLSAIRYVDQGTPAAPAFLVTVRLIYDERPDPFSEYRAGFEIRSLRRCTRIEVWTDADTPALNRAYHLTYLDQLPYPTRDILPLNGVSLLSQIRVEGRDGGASEMLPPLNFSYTKFEPARRDFTAIAGDDLPPLALSHANCELVDLSGNGLPDYLSTDGPMRYWRNLGGGRFDWPREMATAPGHRLDDPGVQLIDADGDGRIDLLVTAGALSGYYPARFGGTWDRRSFQRYRRAPSFVLKDPEVRLVDLDGDGVTDAVRSGARLECFFNDARQGWHDTRFVERRALDVFPNVSFADPHVKWGDMTGDGLQDVVLVSDGNVEYWPSLGRGDWGRRVSMRNSPRLPVGYRPDRILLGDVDGDGLADLVYVDYDKVCLWINQSGNCWSEPIVVPGTPPSSDQDAVLLVDLLGRGIAGVLWSSDATERPRGHMFFLDFTGGIKPYLLDQMDNCVGAVTRVTYQSSTHFYLEDAQRPQTRWKTSLPFPVQVVSGVEVVDAFSGTRLTTQYRYHHGYWDGAEREFRGFGMVERLDAETFIDDTLPAGSGEETQRPSLLGRRISVPLLTRTWFHQGPVGDEFGDWEEVDYSPEFWEEDPALLARPQIMMDFLRSLPRRFKRDALRALRGRIQRSELYALDGGECQDRPYTVTEHLHGVSVVLGDADQWSLVADADHFLADPGADDTVCGVFFPHLLAERATQWERGDDPMTQMTYTDGYDDYGQPLHKTEVFLPRRSARRHSVVGAVVGRIDVDETGVVAVHTQTQYAEPDRGVYLHNRVSQVRTLELASKPVIAERDPASLSSVLREQSAVARVAHRQFRALLNTWRAGEPLPAELRLLGHVLNHYDGTAFTGRSTGEVGPYGSLTRSESLVLTDVELDAAYDRRRPAYLGGQAIVPAGPAVMTADQLGYRLEHDRPPGYHAGYYMDTTRQKFDVQESHPVRPRGLVVALQDPLGHETTVEFDPYQWLPVCVRDAAGLELRAAYDYRVVQPRQLTELNGHSTQFRYTPLGLLARQFLVSREAAGGTEIKPETEFVYDFGAYERTRLAPDPQPISVHTRQRVRHASESVSEATIEAREYSDGFSRLIQRRQQAEELVFGAAGDDVGLPSRPGGQPASAAGMRVADRVVVSGWQVYDNKGRVVEKYEPFFASGWSYQPESDARRGQFATRYYDPRGQVVRIVNPDGSEQRVIFGAPDEIGNPGRYSPTPWEVYNYDANDLAPLSRDPVDQDPDGSPRLLTARAPARHHLTPGSTVLDALGRVICQIARNGPTPDSDWHVTRSAYDSRGNLLSIRDALGRSAFEYSYDLRNTRLRVQSIDAGVRTSVLDAAGNLVERRDSNGNIVLRQYDRLNRLTHLWAGNEQDRRLRLCERLRYGDDLDRAAARSHNLLGRLAVHYDGAGVQCFERCDFKGNLEEQTRQVIADAFLAQGWVPDWSRSNADNALDALIYRTSSRYDALNRPLHVTWPEDVNGSRAVVTPHFNRAGSLDRVEVDGTPYVTQIAYNARGQRVLVAYGNQTMTRLVYDKRTFRLARLRSELFQAAGDTWQGVGPPLQDLAYAYDLVGNITTIDERSPGCGVRNNPQAATLLGADARLATLLARGNALLRSFQYDPLYRLTRADGRASKNIGAPRPLADLARAGFFGAPHAPGPPASNQANAPDLTERYSETYVYDPAGNLLTLSHQSTGAAWLRQFGFAGLQPDQWPSAATNRLTSLRQNGQTHRFEYDANGNLRRQDTDREHVWDHADRMTSFTIRAGSQASVEACYLYDADGLRVKKWVRMGSAGNGESTVYIGQHFEHYTDHVSGLENNRCHVMDGLQRIAILRRGPADPRDAGPDIQYHLGDHLSSSHIVIDSTGDWINREEYFPYGETSFGSFARKRFRFTGQERDEESGLSCHGLRYLAVGLTRWVSCDPALTADGLNAYTYSRNNPLIYIDPGGATAALKVDDNTITIDLHLLFYPDKKLEQQIAQSTNPDALKTDIVPKIVDNITQAWSKNNVTIDGKDYIIRVNIHPHIANTGEELQEVEDRLRAANTPYNKITLYDEPNVFSQSSRSSVQGDTGMWNVDPSSLHIEPPYAHEVGHLLGLSDEYWDLTKPEKWSQDRYVPFPTHHMLFHLMGMNKWAGVSEHELKDILRNNRINLQSSQVQQVSAFNIPDVHPVRRAIENLPRDVEAFLANWQDDIRRHPYPD